MGILDYSILAAVAAAAYFALKASYKARKNGGCSGNCSDCAHSCKE